MSTFTVTVPICALSAGIIINSPSSLSKLPCFGLYTASWFICYDLEAAVQRALAVSLFTLLHRKWCCLLGRGGGFSSKLFPKFGVSLALLRISCGLGCLGVAPAPSTLVLVGSRQKNKNSWWVGERERGKERRR